MMFVAGMAQFICSIIVLKKSGYTFGQWYVGLMCVGCGARALHKTLTQKQVQATFVGAMLCCIVCLAGVIVDAIKYKIIEPLKSCASESTTEGTSCGSSYGGIYNCVGESSYFASAGRSILLIAIASLLTCSPNLLTLLTLPTDSHV